MGRGVGLKFWTFNGLERATKIEQTQIREEFWSLDDNVTIECPPPPWKVFIIKKIRKFSKSFSICSRPTWFFWLIHQHVARTPILGLTKYHLDYHWWASYLCSWPTEPTLRKHSFNNIQIGRFTPANAWAVKSANYFHLQEELLLEAC